MDDNIKKPNFFLIGAPKCGTTAMAHYLKDHPDVFFSNPKEPHYFNTDFTERHRKFLTEEDYLYSCFKGARGYKAVGEGSVFYLLSEEAVPNILKFDSSAKFIVMLRNPVDMAYSFHSQILKSGKEDIPSFEDAWRVQSERKETGQNIPKRCLDARILQYGDVCKLGEQLERLYKQVPREKVKVIFFEDLKDDTQKVYEEILCFLGVVSDRRKDFPIIRKNKIVRYPRLRKVAGFILKIKNKFKINMNTGLINKTLRHTLIEKKREPLEENFKRKLIEFFREDVEKLSRLTDRDLGRWSE